MKEGDKLWMAAGSGLLVEVTYVRTARFVAGHVVRLADGYLHEVGTDCLFETLAEAQAMQASKRRATCTPPQNRYRDTGKSYVGP